MENLKEVSYQIKGLTALLTHSPIAANPLSRYAQIMKELTSKKKKTDADYAEIARVDWEAGLYLTPIIDSEGNKREDGVVCLPAHVIDSCLLNGAKKIKEGPKYKLGVMFLKDYFELDYEGQKIVTNGGRGTIPNPNLDKFYEQYKHQEMVKVNKAPVLRTRPIFYNWSTTIKFVFDTTVLNERTIDAIVQKAGNECGLCEQRPRLGRFSVKKI
jgi:hypothetical protein